MSDERLKHIVPKFTDDLADIKKRWSDMTLNQRMNEIAHLFDNVRVAGYNKERFLEEAAKLFTDIDSQSAIRLWVDTLIMRGPEFLKHNSGEQPDDFPSSFDGLHKKWSILSERERVLALGKLWEAKKEIITRDGKKIGYSLEEFIKAASDIIGEERETIKVVLEKYSGHLKPPREVAREKKAVAKKPKERRGGTPNKPGLPEPVTLTLEAIRKINEAFATRDGFKRLAKSGKHARGR